MTKQVQKSQNIFSSKVNVALSIVSTLVVHEGIMSVESISKHLNLSMYYVEQVIALLNKGEIVKSKRGPNGGYVVQDDYVTVRDVILSIYLDAFKSETTPKLHAKIEELTGTMRVSELNHSTMI